MSGPSDTELWARLAALPLTHGDGSGRDFATVLALRDEWRLVYAEEVIEEYRRLLYLAHLQPVALPFPIARAYALHRSAEDFDALGLPALGEGEYSETRRAYTKTFGRQPPSEIWSAAEARQDPIANDPNQTRRAYWLGIAGMVAVVAAFVALNLEAWFLAAVAICASVGSFWASIRLSRKARSAHRRARGAADGDAQYYDGPTAKRAATGGGETGPDGGFD